MAGIKVDKGTILQYLLAFDPLDGSSNIDVNLSVGTIFSIECRGALAERAGVRAGRDTRRREPPGHRRDAFVGGENALARRHEGGGDLVQFLQS